MSSEETKVFKLPSGPECEIREFTTRAIAGLTQTNVDRDHKRLDQLLKQCIVRIGDVTDISNALVKSILVPDRFKILVTARQFTYGEPDTFIIHHKYKSPSGKDETLDVSVDMKSEFNEEPLLCIEGGGR